MAMSGPDRMQKIYDALAAGNPKVADMTTAERDKMKTQLLQVFGTDTAYIQDKAEVPGAQYTSPAGAAVTTPMGPGSVAAPTTITGTGKVF